MSDQKANNTVLSPKQAAATLQFLQRTQMQGAEMPVYVDIFNTLSAIVAAAPQEMAVSGTEAVAS